MAWLVELLERTSPWVGVLLALLVLAVGVAVGGHLVLRRARGVAHRGRRLGARGHRRGVALLRAAGYRIVAEEASGEGQVQVDGEWQAFRVRADALVSRRRRRYVAEFKNGPSAADVGQRDTRRQLLEYAHVFPVDGILLVDVPGGQVRRIAFPRPERRHRWAPSLG